MLWDFTQYRCESLGILKKQYEKLPNKKVSREDMKKVADFVLKKQFI